MQKIGKNFFVKQMSMNMKEGQTRVVCQLPNGAWILGTERGAQMIRGLDEVTDFPTEVRSQIKEWLTACESNPSLAQPPVEIQPANPANDTAQMFTQLQPEQQAHIGEIIRQYLSTQQDSLRSAQHPMPNTHADGYLEEEADVDPTLRQAVQSSGGQVVVNDQGVREWKPGHTFTEGLGGGEADAQGRVHPGLPEAPGSGAQQLRIPAEIPSAVEEEVQQLG